MSCFYFQKRTYRKKTDHGSCVSGVIQHPLKAIDLKGACQGVQHSTKNPMAPQRKGGEKPRLSANWVGRQSSLSRLKGTSSIASWDVRRLAFDLTERMGIKHRFIKVKGYAWVDWFSCLMKRNPQLSVWVSQATSLARAVGFNKLKVDQFFFFTAYKDVFNSIRDIGQTKIWNMDKSPETVACGGHQGNKTGCMVDQRRVASQSQ